MAHIVILKELERDVGTYLTVGDSYQKYLIGWVGVYAPT